MSTHGKKVIEFKSVVRIDLKVIFKAKRPKIQLRENNQM